MGAKIFQALETDTQEDLKNTFEVARKTFLRNYANITPEELEVFLQKLSFAVKYGVIPIKNGTVYISWTLVNSFSFVASTLTTIGVQCTNLCTLKGTVGREAVVGTGEGLGPSSTPLPGPPTMVPSPLSAGSPAPDTATPMR
ncbi:Potassium channel subfamily K member 2 [Myotis brandtii]|uniref:Potassium channel subfamily K member 2 n=1 Tax=Myotis brandtii TaxID=109478 RepID=S7P5X9_MYOBR|nr:Potassium channel subfamily K member 2 [Myotis brandtii]